jgi:hypothetical protein
MKTTVSIYDFRQAFHDAGRANQFTYDGLRVLYEWIEQLDEDTGSETELDVIAICCEFDESDPQDIAANYSIDLSDVDLDDEDAILDAVLDYLHDNTMVCGTTDAGDIVYAAF